MARIRMQWEISHRADPRGAKLADAHYSRGKPGTPQFVAAGKCLVLVRPSSSSTGIHGAPLAGADAVWATTWPYAEYVRHEWGGAYPTQETRQVERLIRVDSETKLPSALGGGTPLPAGFVHWLDDEIIERVRGGRLTSLRRALVGETPGTWNCAIFRNESAVLSSHLITQAVGATLARWGAPPPLGMVTMIQSDAVRSGGAGRCYIEAGFELVGVTRSKPFKNVYLLPVERMPNPKPARGDGLNGKTSDFHSEDGGSTPSPRLMSLSA